MRCNKNIILKSEILIGHLTDKEKIITLSLVILMLSSINIIPNINNTSALSYQSRTGVSFTFEPTLSISLSSSDLVISNLVPGSSSDSNSINVSVATNASHGYTLAVDTNSEELVHSDNSISNVFSSIATNANLSSLDMDNTWGYSYKNNLATIPTWSSYSGLSTDTSKVLFNTDSNTSNSIDFKIGAKAGNTQASGTYTNTINFIAVSKPMPKTIEDIAYMQTFGELNPTDLESVKNSMVLNHTYTLKDARDEQKYTIAKLNDNKIWMTKNLNLAGGTEITAELSDVPEGYTLPIANGFQEGNRLPASSQEGFSDDYTAYIYNTNNNTDNCGLGCYSYYSWVAATAGSEATPTTSTYALYSICPKGWELPTRNIFNNLISEYSEFYNQAGPNTIPNFVLSGQLAYGTGTFINGDRIGVYWTATKRGSINILNYLEFDSTRVVTGNGSYAKNGLAVRCLAR